MLLWSLPSAFGGSFEMICSCAYGTASVPGGDLMSISECVVVATNGVSSQGQCASSMWWLRSSCGVSIGALECLPLSDSKTRASFFKGAR